MNKRIIIVGGVAGGANAAAGARRLGLGVNPEVGLARDAGLEIGKPGGVRVNEYLQTSNPLIWAGGDAIEVRDGVTAQWALIPLAGPANRQGCIAANNVLGRPSRYERTWGRSILRLFKLTAGYRGAALARRLKGAGCRNVWNLEGGIFAWANAGLPIERTGQNTRRVHPYSRFFTRLLKPQTRISRRGEIRSRAVREERELRS